MNMSYSSLAASKNNDLKEVECEKCDLYNLCQLAGLGVDESTLDTVVERRKTLKSADYLYHAGDKFSGIFSVKSGMFKSIIGFDDGRKQITGFHLPGELIGLEAIDNGAYLQSVIAVENSSACDMNFDEMKNLDNKTIDFLSSVIQAMSRKISLDQYQSLLTGAQSAEQKLALFLINTFCRLQDHEIQTHSFKIPTRIDIANYLGLAMETVCRIFKSFEKNQLIEIKSRHVNLCDFNELQKLTGLVNYNSKNTLI